MFERELLYAICSEEDLNKILEGLPVAGMTGWYPHQMQMLPSGQVGVLMASNGTTTYPLAIVTHEESLRRLYGRFSHVRSEFSPLSAWTHVLMARYMESLDGPSRVADLHGLEAAWAGLAVAEAQILSSAPVSALRISACLATRSFAVARCLSLWPHIPFEEVVDTYEGTRRALKANGVSKAAEVLRPIWATLSSISARPSKVQDYQHRMMADVAERLIEKYGTERVSAAAWIFEPLSTLTQTELRTFERSSPEQRLHVFDALVSKLNDLPADSPEYPPVAMQAGFVATVAAGGAPSLSLAESQLQRHPMILGWAYALGGLGERITWTGSFDGLGRLVARELVRPFHLADPPTCDFDVNEFRLLIDPELKDPLVHLRVKQSRSVQIALFPGVNVVFSLPDGQRSERTERKQSLERTNQPSAALPSDVLAVLADALLPYLNKSSAAGTTTEKTTRKRKSDPPKNRSLPFGRK